MTHKIVKETFSVEIRKEYTNGEYFIKKEIYKWLNDSNCSYFPLTSPPRIIFFNKNAASIFKLFFG